MRTSLLYNMAQHLFLLLSAVSCAQAFHLLYDDLILTTDGVINQFSVSINGSEFGVPQTYAGVTFTAHAPRYVYSVTRNIVTPLELKVNFTASVEYSNLLVSNPHDGKLPDNIMVPPGMCYEATQYDFLYNDNIIDERYLRELDAAGRCVIESWAPPKQWCCRLRDHFKVICDPNGQRIIFEAYGDDVNVSATMQAPFHVKSRDEL